MEGFLSGAVVPGLTLKVSGDAEGLGFLELGNSRTLEWGIRKPWPLTLRRGHGKTHSSPDAVLPHSHSSASIPLSPSTPP